MSDEQLLQCIEPGFDWDAMAATHVPVSALSLADAYAHATLQERSGKDCEIHWLHEMSPAVNHAPWSAEEDKALVLAVGKARCHTCTPADVDVTPPPSFTA